LSGDTVTFSGGQTAVVAKSDAFTGVSTIAMLVLQLLVLM